MSKILRPSLQALKISPLFGQTLIGSSPYLTLSGFTLLLKLLKFLARLMPLPSLKLRLLNSKLAGNAHFELALAADLDFTNTSVFPYRVWHLSCLFCLSVAGLSFPFSFFTNASNAFLEGA